MEVMDGRSMVDSEAENQVLEWYSRKREGARSLLMRDYFYLYLVEDAMILCSLLFIANFNK